MAFYVRQSPIFADIMWLCMEKFKTGFINYAVKVYLPQYWSDSKVCAFRRRSLRKEWKLRVNWFTLFLVWLRAMSEWDLCTFNNHIALLLIVIARSSQSVSTCMFAPKPAPVRLKSKHSYIWQLEYYKITSKRFYFK